MRAQCRLHRQECPRATRQGVQRCREFASARALAPRQAPTFRIPLLARRNLSARAADDSAADAPAADAAAGDTVIPPPLVAVDGDIVTLHYDCKDSEGEMIDSTRRREEPLTLELGVGEIVGNPLVQALEQAVRSHGVGDLVELQLKGGDYKPELVFKVPTDHPEITRLQGRYKSQGGLEVDKVVELQNGQWAKVLDITDSEVTIDANNMLAGLERIITVEILKIDRPPPGEQ